ncbi:MAG: flagellar hook-associated protein FlgL [Arcobacteraceae bacterium]|nr:flagellar hook-associated protein FlgL [Arcobacteraceae bacterium]
MIDLSSQMIYRIDNLNVQNERISYQMSTGKILQNGSDDSVLYGRYLNIENKLRDSEGLKTQIDKTVAQNNVADKTIDEVKTSLESIKQDLLKSLNAGMSRSDKLAVATNVSGMRDNLLRLANTQIDGEYIFAGSNTTVQPYTQDTDFVVNGQINFNGNSHLRNVAVDSGVYRERGVTSSDVFMYNTDTTATDKKLSFTQQEMVIDQNGYTWKLNGAGDKLEKYNQDGTVTSGPDAEYLTVIGDSANPQTYTTEDITTAANIKSTTKSGLLLEAKHNIFDDLNVIINALKGYATVSSDGANNGEQDYSMTDTEQRDVLSNYLGKVDEQYSSTNIGHAELGGRNKVFETYLDSISTKITHYNILIQETDGVDYAKLSMESKALETTYSALYSTVSKMNQLSLINYLK